MFLSPFGVYGKGATDWILDELELGKRVAHWLDSENNASQFHFETYGIHRKDHWLHNVWA